MESVRKLLAWQEEPRWRGLPWVTALGCYNQLEEDNPMPPPVPCRSTRLPVRIL